jgi:hypothetical protein
MKKDCLSWIEIDYIGGMDGKSLIRGWTFDSFENYHMNLIFYIIYFSYLSGPPPTPVRASRARWVRVRVHVIVLGIVGHVLYGNCTIDILIVIQKFLPSYCNKVDNWQIFLVKSSCKCLSGLWHMSNV